MSTSRKDQDIRDLELEKLLISCDGGNYPVLFISLDPLLLVTKRKKFDEVPTTKLVCFKSAIASSIGLVADRYRIDIFIARYNSASGLDYVADPLPLQSEHLHELYTCTVIEGDLRPLILVQDGRFFAPNFGSED